MPPSLLPGYPPTKCPSPDSPNSTPLSRQPTLYPHHLLLHHFHLPLLLQPHDPSSLSSPLAGHSGCV
ncbi:hypothetical protein E2C01_076002 [Portunus trituberculatus]|uniref:Uncharacterized protein n=1 Tax=Portunus trituberculatus TaxID=210409 RepID=A0A5B7IKW2_PORTR|nr:hypothetical protein [Portunus trituberculatus]